MEVLVAKKNCSEWNFSLKSFNSFDKGKSLSFLPFTTKESKSYRTVPNIYMD